MKGRMPAYRSPHDKFRMSITPLDVLFLVKEIEQRERERVEAVIDKIEADFKLFVSLCACVRVCARKTKKPGKKDIEPIHRYVIITCVNEYSI